MKTCFMYIDDFIWLPNILDKVEVKHQVLQDEVEEIFFLSARDMDKKERRRYERK